MSEFNKVIEIEHAVIKIRELLAKVARDVIVHKEYYNIDRDFMEIKPMIQEYERLIKNYARKEIG